MYLSDIYFVMLAKEKLDQNSTEKIKTKTKPLLLYWQLTPTAQFQAWQLASELTNMGEMGK